MGEALTVCLMMIICTYGGCLRLFSIIGGLGLRAEAWGLTFAKWIFFPIESFEASF